MVEALTPGSEVWVRNGGWATGVLRGPFTDSCEVSLGDGQIIRTTKSDVLPRAPAEHDAVADLTALMHLHEPALLQCLRNRHADKSVYTATGEVLIAVNPYQTLDIYHEEILSSHRRAEGAMPPHVYGVADRAFRALLRDSIGQSIVVNGESGAGKTETSRHLMWYLAAVGGGTSGSHINSQLLSSTPMLEAFGNARTLRNDNSSRFGKFTQMLFRVFGGSAAIVGGRISTYLLEKSRVVFQAPGERNYHIFYQLCAGASPEEREVWDVPNADAFGCLSKSGCTLIPGVDDAASFAVTRAAMQTVGISDESCSAVFRILAGLLHLANVPFSTGRDGVAVIADSTPLTTAARLLRCDAAALAQALCTRVIITPGECIVKPLESHDAASGRDALVKVIYERVFLWLVDAINATTVYRTPESSSSSTPEPGANAAASDGTHATDSNGAAARESSPGSTGSNGGSGNVSLSATASSAFSSVSASEHSGTLALRTSESSATLASTSTGGDEGVMSASLDSSGAAIVFRKHRLSSPTSPTTSSSPPENAPRFNAGVSPTPNASPAAFPLSSPLITPTHAAAAFPSLDGDDWASSATTPTARTPTAGAARSRAVPALAASTVLPDGAMLLPVGILDIYGFETFASNSLEQLCINYANERLQRAFNAHVFQQEQDEYKREGINWAYVTYTDNQGTLDLIEKNPVCLLSMLDEECRFPKGTDSTFVAKIRQRFAGNPSFDAPRLLSESFTVRHYAGDVTYSGEDFLAKNKDFVSPERLAVLSRSETPLLRELFPSATNGVESDAKGARAGGATETVATKFRSSLASLMVTINATALHFVRCIKPNDSKSAEQFDADKVLQQLRCGGVLETVRVTAAGYPTRVPFAAFSARYRVLCPYLASIGRLEEVCTGILHRFDLVSPIDYQIGKTRVLMRPGRVAILERALTARRAAAALAIQRNVRRYRQQKRYRRLLADKRAAIRIQSTARAWIARRRYGRVKASAITLQRHWRGRCARLLVAKMRAERAALRIQSFFRGFAARKRYRRDRRRVIVLQSLARRRAAQKIFRFKKQAARQLSTVLDAKKKLEGKVEALQWQLREEQRARVSDRTSLEAQVEEQASLISSLKAQLGTTARSPSGNPRVVLEPTHTTSKGTQTDGGFVSRPSQPTEKPPSPAPRNDDLIEKLQQEVARLRADVSYRDHLLNDLNDTLALAHARKNKEILRANKAEEANKRLVEELAALKAQR